MNDRQIMGCAVCGAVLDSIVKRSTGEFMGYAHSNQTMGFEPEDHVVVPVPIEDLPNLRVKCDFCFAEITRETTWTVPATDFPMPTGIEGDTSLGDWAACARCAELITKGRWNYLASRATVGAEAEHRRLGQPMPPADELNEFLIEVYARLREHMTGIPQLG